MRRRMPNKTVAKQYGRQIAWTNAAILPNQHNLSPSNVNDAGVSSASTT